MPPAVFDPSVLRPDHPDDLTAVEAADDQPARRRRGRPPKASADGIATEIRRQRDALGLTLEEAAKLTQVSPTVICEVERGTRAPSLRTYAKLREGLGLAEPATALLGRRVPQVPADDLYRATLAVCVLMAKGATLADLAAALGISIPAVRETLSVLTDRLAQVGLALVDDGVAVGLVPLPFAHDAVSTLIQVDPLPAISDEQLAVLCIVAHAGMVTRRRIDEIPGIDSESLLRRMVDAGQLECAHDDGVPHAPNLYRVTAIDLAALGYPTREAFTDAVASRLDPAELLKAQQLDSASAPRRS
jgi:chromosome segregation and condensation protein ScpB